MALLCKICKVDLERKAIFNHFKFVHFGVNYLPCPFPNCPSRLRGCKSVIEHIRRTHYSPNVEKLTFVCIRCTGKIKSFNILNSLLHHLNKEHISKNVETVSCPFKNCKFETNVSGTWRSHYSRYHTVRPVSSQLLCDDYILNSEADNAVEISEPVNCFVTTDEMTDFDDPLDFTDNRNSSSANILPPNFEKQLALFFLKMQVIWHIPQNAIQEILQGFGNLNQLLLSSTKQNIFAKLESLGIAISKDIIDDLFKESVEQFSETNQLFCTPYRRENYFTQNLPYVEPVELKITSKSGKKFTVVYVPILSDLNSWLSHEDVYRQLASNQASNVHGFYSDYSDGNFYHQNKLFNSPDFTLKLCLYYDDWTATNPIGMYARKRKLSAFYYTLGNLSRKHRSCLQSIRLSILCSHSAVKECGLPLVLSPLIADIEKLENIGVWLDKFSRNVKGTIASICADNLAAHALGGYPECFSRKVLRICRFCLATSEKIQLNLARLQLKGLAGCMVFQNDSYYASDFEVRNPANYAAHIAAIEAKEVVWSVYGIKFNSPFNRLQYAHVTQLLPPDPMHDFGEGIIPYEMQLYLNYFINIKKYFTYDYLQMRLRTFKFGKNDKRNISDFVHPDFAKRDNIGGNATKNVYLLRFIPLLVGHKVSEIDIVWNCLINLHKIVQMVYAESISSVNIAILDSLIREHRNLFRISFPEQSLKPKHHYIEHYPYLMQQFGPLVNFQTARFEAKHAFFKRVIHRTMNFKNICMTLAKRHQLWISVFMSSPEYFKPALDITNYDLKQKSSFGNEEQLILEATFPNTVEFKSVSSVVMHGQEYHTASHLTQVAQQLISTFPALKDNSGNGWETWLRSLQDKMSNFRKTMRKTGWESVKQNSRKRNRSSPKKAKPHNKNIKKASRGEVNFRPNYPPGEDEDSLRQHKNAMIGEVKRKTVDDVKIRSLMNNTFALRRKVVTDKIADDSAAGERFRLVSEILEDWPALKSKDHILDEFYRITNIELSQKWYQNLDGLLQNIIDYAKNRKGRFSTQMDELLHNSHAEENDDICLKRSVALKIIPTLLNENSDLLFKTFNEEIEFENLGAGGFVAIVNFQSGEKYSVIIENECIVDNCTSFAEAIMVLMACHYAFNLTYNAPLSMDFLQRAVIQSGLKDKKPVPKVLTLLHNLKISL